MKKLLSHITAYLDYIRKECTLYVSIHFDESVLHHLPQTVLRKLLPYNSHLNPYCFAVKKNHHAQCRAHQKDIIKECCTEGSCRMCHAGVWEYIFPIRKDETTIGYVAISGYREKTVPTACPDSALWENALRKEKIPVWLCEALAPPLAIMLEQIFIRYAKEPANEFNMFVNFLSEYHTDITLTDLCRHFGRSKSYISHMFKRESGMTLRAYCNALKLEDAKNLLLDTTLSITEIALDSGFNDTSYFISLFSKKFGVSPLQYRKQHENP